jgi:DNA-binding winged helix-turn-helix (wHTH) protein
MPVSGVIADHRAFEFGPFVLEPAERRLSCQGAPVALPPRAFDVLVLLVTRAGRLVSKQDLFERIWRGAIVSDGALTQCVRQIRAVLDDDAATPRFVATVPRAGYRFVARVSPVLAGPPMRSTAAAPADAATAPRTDGARALYLRGRAGSTDVLERNRTLLRGFLLGLGATTEVTLVVVEERGAVVEPARGVG